MTDTGVKVEWTLSFYLGKLNVENHTPGRFVTVYNSLNVILSGSNKVSFVMSQDGHKETNRTCK